MNMESIPDKLTPLQLFLRDALSGARLRSRNMGVTFASDTPLAERITVIQTLLESQQQVTTRIRFYIGDCYRQTTARSDLRKQFCFRLKELLGENYYNLVREYGWVAKKWPEDRRNPDLAWRYYVHNKPRKPGEPAQVEKPKPAEVFTPVSVEKWNGGWILHFKDKSGREWNARLKPEDLAQAVEETEEE